MEAQAFVEKIKEELGIAVRHREIDDGRGMCVLREPGVAYRPDFGIETGPLKLKDAIFWEKANACG